MRIVDLEQYIKDIVFSLNRELKHKKVEVKVECKEDLFVPCHTGAIYQILLNLLMNSLKHAFENKEDGQIKIIVEPYRYEHHKIKWDGIKLTYHDNGLGIPTSDIKKIFDPFYTTRRHDGGSGLGLNIVYNLVTQRLKGFITCTSVINEYTEFEILFPLEEK